MPIVVSEPQKQALFNHLDNMPMSYAETVNGQSFGFASNIEVIYYPAGARLIDDTRWLASNNSGLSADENNALRFFFSYGWQDVVGDDEKLFGVDAVVAKATYTCDDDQEITFDHEIQLTKPRICLRLKSEAAINEGQMGTVFPVYQVTEQTPTDTPIHPDRLCKKVNLASKPPQTIDYFKQSVQNETEALHVLTDSSRGFWVNDNQTEFFLDMEKMPGKPLDELLDKTLKNEARIRLALALIDALKELHEKKHVLHRDLKPEHFFIDEVAGQYQVHIIDFGLARSITDVKDTIEETMLIGSPFYMAPEVANTAGERGVYLHSCESEKYALVGVLAQVLGAHDAFEYKKSVASEDNLDQFSKLAKLSNTPYNFLGILAGESLDTIKTISACLTKASINNSMEREKTHLIALSSALQDALIQPDEAIDKLKEPLETESSNSQADKAFSEEWEEFSDTEIEQAKEATKGIAQWTLEYFLGADKYNEKNIPKQSTSTFGLSSSWFSFWSSASSQVEAQTKRPAPNKTESQAGAPKPKSVLHG